MLGNNQILRHVDESTGQVTRVGGLERCISQPFSSTVRRNEVLHHRQTFTEVCRDRRFDDGAIRLGHQTTHTGKLTNLCGGTPGA